jgi:hypothetical protein
VTLAFAARRDVVLTVEIFSVAGRRLWTRQIDAAAHGQATLTWDGRGQDGQPVASGIYLARFSGAGQVLGREVLVLRR